MDCSAEEQLVRMQLQGMPGIQKLLFNLGERKLQVFHEGEVEAIDRSLSQLNLGSRRESTEEADDLQSNAQPATETNLLRIVLYINLALFAVEMIAGLLAGSMGLVADSLDMLADSLVYGLALIAVRRTTSTKKKVAAFSGILQLVLAITGIIEVIRRFAGKGEVPDHWTMIIVSIIALGGNAICLYMLSKSKSNEAHIRASVIFTSNDVIVNIGVILAAILVLATGSGYPDLVIGSFVFLLVALGAFRILRLSR